jgi:hypothetical protein
LNHSSPRRIVLSWLAVVGAFILALEALDRLPTLLSGTPHGVRVYASVEEAQRAVGARIWLPAYYPDTLAWPPARIDAWPGPPAMVALHVAARAGGQEWLVLVQSFTAPANPPPVLLPPVQVLTTSDVTVGGRAAILTRVVAPGGEVMHDVTWDHGRRRMTLRFRGPVEQLLLIAESLERAQS